MAMGRWDSVRLDKYGRQFSCYYSNNYGTNPFKGDGNDIQAHPVEEALWLATDYKNDADTSSFKAHRATALEYLEPQYRAIINAHTSVREFVEEVKTEGRILAPGCVGSWEIDSSDALKGLVLLKRYARAFQREMPFSTELMIAKHNQYNNCFDMLYMTMPREKLMAELELSVKTEDFERFAANFKLTTDDMDAQFLEIRQARRNLFKADTTGIQCKIDPMSCVYQADEMVNWTSDTEDNDEDASEDGGS